MIYKAALLLGLTGMIGCGRSRPQMINETGGSIVFPLTVTDCKGNLATIYADREATMPLANPIYPDRSGKVQFWAKGGIDLCYPRGDAK